MCWLGASRKFLYIFQHLGIDQVFLCRLRNYLRFVEHVNSVHIRSDGHFFLPSYEVILFEEALEDARKNAPRPKPSALGRGVKKPFITRAHRYQRAVDILTKDGNTRLCEVYGKKDGFFSDFYDGVEDDYFSTLYEGVYRLSRADA